MLMNNEEQILAEYAECGIYEDLDSSYDGNESVGFKDSFASPGKQVNGQTQKAATDIKKVPSCRELRRHSDSNHRRPLEDSHPNAEIVAVWQKRLSKEASIPDIVDEDPNIVILSDDESDNGNVGRKSNCVLDFDPTAAEEIEDDEEQSLTGGNEGDNNENNPEVLDETRSCSHSDDHHDLRIQPTIDIDVEREDIEREEVDRAYDFDEFDCEEPEVENVENVENFENVENVEIVPPTTDDQFLEKAESSCEVHKRVRCGSIGTARTDVEDSVEWEAREAGIGRGVQIDLGKVKSPPYCEYDGDRACCLPYDDCTGTGRSDEGNDTSGDEKTEHPSETILMGSHSHIRKRILLPLNVAPERKHNSAVHCAVSFLKTDPCPCPPLGAKTRNTSLLRGQTDGLVARNILKPKKQVLPMRVQKQNSQDMAAKLLKSRVDAAMMKKRQIMRKLSIGESDSESQTNDGCNKEKDKDRERRRSASQNNNCLIPMGCYERRSRDGPRDGVSESRVQDPSKGSGPGHSQSPNRSLSLINPTHAGSSLPVHASRPAQYPALSPARASLSPVRASAPHSQGNSSGGTGTGAGVAVGAGVGVKPAQGWGHGPGQGRPDRERYCAVSSVSYCSVPYCTVLIIISLLHLIHPAPHYANTLY